jgi:apolipoprotein N-acyltransferase
MQTLPIALAGSILLWAALPPLALGWLGWIAPIPWLLLIRGETLTGRRPYRTVYLAGLIFWLMAIHWLRLPHPAVYLGWFALSAYLAIYLPIFIGLSRVAVHRLNIPLWIAAPVVWTGLELARAHLLTGFLMASLAHTQVKQTQLIQISDLFGEYGVDFLIVLVAGCIVSAVRVSHWNLPTKPNSQLTFSFHPLSLIPAAIAVAASFIYGHYRIDEVKTAEAETNRTFRVALIQGNSLADWKMDEDKQMQIMDEYRHLSKQAVEKSKSQDGRAPDLVVWPETMYRNPLREFEPEFQLPTGVTETTDEISASDRQNLAYLVKALDTPVLVGIDRVEFLADDGAQTNGHSYRAYNSAALIDARGEIAGTYDKFHLVMFGEYVPFAEWLPFLNGITSLTGSAVAGAGPVVLCLDDVCFAPNICYETVIPHVIRRQARLIDDPQKPPGMLVNMTNDAWYWGSSELDQHLACGVFRAIETRKPLVIAANGGISAWIDRTGVVRAQSPKQKPDVLLADVELAHMTSWYLNIGDIFAIICLTACVALAIIGRMNRSKSASISPSPAPSS